jgi:hypothetical protein
MNLIDHLPLDEQKHFILCNCGQYVDCRDLQQVFDHEHWMEKKLDVSWKFAILNGEPVAYTKTKRRVDVN